MASQCAQLSIYDDDDETAEYELVEDQALLQPYIAAVRRQIWAVMDLVENGGRRVEAHVHAAKQAFEGDLF